MATLTATNIDNTSLLIEGRSYRDDTFTFPGAATYTPGMLLARNTTTSKLVPYVDGGANGTGTPVSVLTYEITATGAGDQAIRRLQDGIVRADYLFALADLPTVGVTDQLVLDSLQDYNIAAVFSDNRSFYDN